MRGGLILNSFYYSTHPYPQYTHHAAHRSTDPRQVRQEAAGNPGRPHRIQDHLNRHAHNPADLMDEPAPFVDNLDMDTVKMYVIAPGDKRQSVDYVDCYARVVLINRDWYVDEKVNVIYEWISV